MEGLLRTGLFTTRELPGLQFYLPRRFVPADYGGERPRSDGWKIPGSQPHR